MIFVPVLKPTISRSRINTAGLETKATTCSKQMAPHLWNLPLPYTKHSFQICSLLLGVKHNSISELGSLSHLKCLSSLPEISHSSEVEGNKEHWTICTLVSLSVNHKFGLITWQFQVSCYKQELWVFIIAGNEASFNVFSSRSSPFKYLRRECSPVCNTANARQANPSDVMFYSHTHATELTELERDCHTASKDTNKEGVHSPKD